jgi:peptidyl-prolyl cis-trans isomerase C
LAQQLSNCPSAQVGGNLGQLTRADVVPEFWQVVATFAENEGAGVLPRLVETRYGLHIVRVARYLPGKPLPFEAVRDSIAARLAQRALHAALRDYAHALFHSTGHAH